MALKDKLFDIAFDVGAEAIKNTLDKERVRDRISSFIEQEYSKNISVTSEEEFDAEGLFEYLRTNYIIDVRNLLKAIDSDKRDKLHQQLLDKAVLYSQATNRLSEDRAKKIVSDGIALLRDYYNQKINGEWLILATQVVEELSNEMTDEIHNLREDMESNTLMSADTIAKFIRVGEFDEAASIMSKNASIINDEHCLKPYYGIQLDNINGKSQLRSIPLVPEAKELFPPIIHILSGEIEIDNKAVEQIDIGLLNYSYNHQVPIKINVTNAVKTLGPIKDPFQYEAQEFVGRSIELQPQEFPPAFPCSISIDDTIYFEYLLLRTKEILEDGTIVIDNREEKNRRFIAEFRMNIGKQSLNINIKVISGKNKDKLIYNKFAYKASLGGEFAINILDMNEKLAFSYIKNSVGSDKYLNDIDILKKVVALEDYFHKDISIPDFFPIEEYNALNWLYEVITKDEFKYKWKEYTLQFDLGKLKKETILKTEDLAYAMKLTLPLQIEFFDLKENIQIRRTINNLRIKDLDKLKQKVTVLDDDDPIKVIIIPNRDNPELNECIDELIKDVSA